jgi:hypothetical protein
MTSVVAVRWEPVTGVDWPCADILFAYSPPDALHVRMRFSNVVGVREADLVLEFSGAIAAQWESESFGLISLPDLLPKCRSPRWDTWTFPLLRIDNSEWLATYHARNPFGAEGRCHYVIVTMNDLLHVLARPTLEATWASPLP